MASFFRRLGSLERLSLCLTALPWIWHSAKAQGDLLLLPFVGFCHMRLLYKLMGGSYVHENRPEDVRLCSYGYAR